MAVTFQLTPELEKGLALQARSQCISLERYIQLILERQLALPGHATNMSEEEFNAELDGLAAYSDKIPSIPLSLLRRDEIYRDHD